MTYDQWMQIAQAVSLALYDRDWAARSLTYDAFIDRLEHDRRDRMRVEANRRRRNAMSKFRAWYRIRWVEG